MKCLAWMRSSFVNPTNWYLCIISYGWLSAHGSFECSASSLSDLGDRSEASGKLRTVFRSFEENSRRY